MTRHDYDVWLCMACNREWVTPSVPHNPKCPGCGTPGWFQRFATGDAYEVAGEEGAAAVAAQPTRAKRVRCRCKNADRHFGVCKCHRHKGDTVSPVGG